MARIGVLTLPSASHFMVAFAIGKALARRGHTITFYEVAENRKVIEDAGFDFREWGPKDLSIKPLLKAMSVGPAMEENRRMVSEHLTERIKYALAEIPDLMKKDGIDCVLADQANLEQRTVAELVGVPFVTFCNSIMQLQELDVPPFCTTLQYDPSFLGRVKNAWAYRSLNNAYYKPRLTIINQHRGKHGLQALALNECWSSYANIIQQAPTFDFPRKNAPPHLHYMGPLDDPSTRKSPPFPFEKLTGAPLVYCSMGTINTRDWRKLEMIAEACAELPIQLVMSAGGVDRAELPKFAGSPIVESFVPQIEILKRASLFIAQGGPKSAQESLALGVPILAFPATLDQFGSSGRIKWLGVGECLDPQDLSRENILKYVRLMLSPSSSYKSAALEFSKSLKNCGGIEAAATVIESVIASKKPVTVPVEYRIHSRAA